MRKVPAQQRRKKRKRSRDEDPRHRKRPEPGLVILSCPRLDAITPDRLRGLVEDEIVDLIDLDASRVQQSPRMRSGVA